MHDHDMWRFLAPAQYYSGCRALTPAADILVHPEQVGQVVPVLRLSRSRSHVDVGGYRLHFNVMGDAGP